MVSLQNRRAHHCAGCHHATESPATHVSFYAKRWRARNIDKPEVGGLELTQLQSLRQLRISIVAMNRSGEMPKE